MFAPEEAACAANVETVSVHNHQRPPKVSATERALARAIVIPGSSGGWWDIDTATNFYIRLAELRRGRYLKKKLDSQIFLTLTRRHPVWYPMVPYNVNYFGVSAINKIEELEVLS